MAVQPRAFVTRRHMRQAMSGFESKDAEDIHAALALVGKRVVLVREVIQAALRLRCTQLQVPQAQRMEVHSVHTEKSTEPKWRRQLSQ